LKGLAGLVLLCACVQAESPPAWTVAKSDHFEIYSQAGGDAARSALIWFEELRAFFQQTGVDLDERQPIRVIAFRSAKEYNAYRLRPTADAYYVGTESRDYIVMPALGADRFRVAAHEYAHAMMHAAGLKFPLWLGEGIAEFFSTIRIGAQGCEIGGELPAHSQVLQRRAWVPLADLFALSEKSPFLESRENSSVFYAESWMITEMLVLSPAYSSRLSDLFAALKSGAPGVQALPSVYGKPLNRIARDAQLWAVKRNAQPVKLPGVSMDDVAVTTSALSPFAARSLIAELILATGELDRAETLYRDLERESPENGGVWAALGTIAIRKGDRESALQHWRQALQMGVDDASLCFRYAVLAEEAGLPANEIRAALERAIELNPNFDDARYRLALLENNTGDYQTALGHFQAMRHVNPARAYGYWSAMAYALDELGRREDAQAAAQKATVYAATPSEREHAAQLAYVAQTDVAVQFSRDANGRTQLITRRVPHGTTDWNPFIEPGDEIRRAEGQLRSIDCQENKVTGVSIQAADEQLNLSIPDPLQVLMRNAPNEFTCGAQSGVTVLVQFAISKSQAGNVNGILRSMEFR